MAVHFLHGSAHVDRQQTNFGVLVLKDNKKLVRKTLPRGAKVGHMGTLDPEASGVLPIGTGKAARLFDYASDKEKGYRAEIRLGV